MSELRNIFICFPEGKHKVLTMSYDDGRVDATVVWWEFLTAMGSGNLPFKLRIDPGRPCKTKGVGDTLRRS